MMDTPRGELEGGNVTFIKETVVKSGESIFYDVIPFEMIKTYVEKPQLEVTVKGLPALCHGMNCSFEYVKSVGEISSFSYDKATKKLSISGTSLPTNSSELKSINFGLK